MTQQSHEWPQQVDQEPTKMKQNDKEAPPVTITGTSEVLRNKNIIGTRFNFSFLNNAEEAVTLYRGVTETNREDDKQRKKDKNPKQTRVLNKTDEEVICGDKNIINTDFTNVTDPINDPLADFSNVSLRDKAISKDINNLTAHTVNFIGNYKHCSPAMSGGLPAQRGEASPYLLLEQTLLAFYQDYGRVPYLFQDEPLASQRCFELGTNYIQLHLVENPANNAAQNERSAFSPVKLTRCGECTVATLLKPMQWPRGPTIVFGQAGMGKSTLSQYMAYLWSQRNSISDCPVGLAECEIVFYLPLRYLKRYRPSEAFKPGAMTDDILAGVLLFLFRQLYPQKTLEAERGDKLSVSMLATLVKERADSVLFIVDGLDEITTELKDSQGFHHQFVRYLLLQPRVMLTSRPIVIQPSLLPVKQQKEDCRWLEVKGFHEDSMNAYISDYFGQRGEDLVSKGEQLQCYLNNNALLFDICHTPINLALLCVVWEEDKTLLQAPPGPDIKPEVKQDKDVTTPSFNTIDIYQRLLLFLQRRYVKRSLALQPNAVDCINKFNEKTLDEQQAYIQTYCADLMDFLMVLATYGMTHDELAFSGDTLTNLLEQQAPLLRKFYQRLPSAYQHSLKKQHEPLPGEPPVSKHRLQQIAFLQGLREFGLLAFASPGGNLAGQEIWFSFLHLSFQEYLAAHHLVARLRRCLEDRRDPQQDSAIRWTVVRYKYEPRYRRFWQFVMGEVSQDNLLFAAIEALRCGVLPIKHWGVQDSEANERIEQDLKNCWLSGVSAQADNAVKQALAIALRQDLNHLNVKVRYEALDLLASLPTGFKTGFKDSYDILAGLLERPTDDENPSFQCYILRVIIALGAPLATHETVIKRVIAGLESEYEHVQEAALGAVIALGVPLATHEAFIKRVIVGLASNNAQAQCTALRVVMSLDVSLATHKAVITGVIAELASDNAQVRQTALEVECITGTIAAPKSNNLRVQRTFPQLVETLRAPLATHEAVIKRIIAGLASDNLQVQQAALGAVRVLGAPLATNQTLINSLLVMLASDSWELQQGQSKIVAALDAILGHSVLTYCLSNAKLSQAAHQWSPKTVIQRYLCQTEKKFMLYLEKHSSCYLVLDGETQPVHSVPLTREEVTLLLSLTDGHDLLTAHALSGYTVVRPTEGSNATAEEVDNAIDHRPVFKPSSTEIAASLRKAANAKCILPALQDNHYDNIIQPVTIKKSNVFKDFSRYLTSAEKTQLKDALTVINELLVDMDVGDESGDKASLMRLRSSLLSKATDLAEFDISQEGAQAYLASIIQTMEEIEKAQQVQATYFRDYGNSFAP